MQPNGWGIDYPCLLSPYENVYHEVMFRSDTVSYTHLDVYKRQELFTFEATVLIHYPAICQRDTQAGVQVSQLA